MKISSRIILIAVLGLFSSNIMATQLPSDIYHPASAEILKVQPLENGEFVAEFKVNAEHISIRELAARVIADAREKGFSVEQSMVKRDNADIKFYRDNQKLKVSLELKSPRAIEYKAALDLNKN